MLAKDAGVPSFDDIVSKNLILIVCLSLAIAVLTVIVWFFANGLITLPTPDQVLVHDRLGNPYVVAPEPVERTVFVTLAALAPIMLVGWFWACGMGRINSSAPRRVPLAIDVVLPFVAASFLCLLFWYSDFLDIFFFSTPWMKSHKRELIGVALCLSLIVMVWKKPLPASYDRWTAAGWWMLAAIAIALQILPYRIESVNAVTVSPVWSVHLDAVMYPINQVVHGATLIADLPSQYGFYPEIISPIFKLVGVSVLSVTVFFAILHAMALFAVAAIVTKYVRSRLIALMAFLTILIATSLFMYLNGIVEDIYVQYYPIRFFWPAVALLLFASYSANPGRAKLWALGAVAGLSIFWNIDTGIPVMISIAATLFVKPIIARRAFLQGTLTAALFSVVAVCTVLACFVVIRIKAGGPLDLGDVLAYQKIFYMTGFGMIPMPLVPDPWQAVLAIYIAGAVTALSGWARGHDRSVNDVLFCSALLGLGLFTYFQGRSHVFCLVLVAWPAILISAILADQTLRAVSKRTTRLSSAILTLPFLMFFSLGTLTFISASQDLFASSKRNLSSLKTAKDATVVDELSFMRSTYRGRNCLILSQRQAIYSAELGIASPLKGPGLVETILQQYLDKIVDRALHDPVECVYLGVKEGTITYIDVGDALLKARFPVISTNPLGTMMLLEPAPGIPDHSSPSGH